ncbi:MAG: heterocyst frequency control protein PatD [Spirulina sp. SIO3F2]|nr:heterocyst frequency control protein PatD [Spirulina sp. SIO3F2]
MPRNRTELETINHWLGQLQTLQSTCTHQSTIAADSLALMQQASEVQQVYQTEIACLALFENHPQGQAILTEVHRYLRLVETQCLFLKTARSSAKQQQQQTVLGQQISAIIELIQALLSSDVQT